LPKPAPKPVESRAISLNQLWFMRKPETFVRTGAFEVTRYDLLGKKYLLSSTEQIQDYFDIFFTMIIPFPFAHKQATATARPRQCSRGPADPWRN
jgi:hypothetical protein